MSYYTNVMGCEKNYNLVQKEALSARVPVHIRDAFWKTCPKGMKHSHLMETAAKLWVSLPVDIRKSLLDELTCGMDWIDRELATDISPAAQIVDDAAASSKAQKRRPSRPARPKEA